MYLWVPDHFYADLVPYMPCSVEDCKEVTQRRRRWHSGGPRLIHGVHHAVYLHCWEYECPSADHKGKTFSGWDHGSLAKLRPLVRSLFRFVLTAEDGVTLELHGRIVDARVGGASMNALRKEMQRNRYARMYETMSSYYLHIEHYSTRGQLGFTRGYGSDATFPPMPPTLHNPTAYYDWEPPSARFMASVRHQYGLGQMALWSRYAQQLTASRVCIDSTFKV